ncbi:MAG: hypothetical protein ACK4RK_07760 [Gemmataceae bacterium]
MATVKLEDRVAALEVEVAWLKAKVEAQEKKSESWWHKIAGTFANDPIYEEAMRLGQEWRKSFRSQSKTH